LYIWGDVSFQLNKMSLEKTWIISLRRMLGVSPSMWKLTFMQSPGRLPT
jgi:hypothetical protein